MCGLAVDPHDKREPSTLVRFLLSTYWLVGLVFLAVVVAFVRDRACFDSLNLLPTLARRPGAAWIVACAYLSGYSWLAAAYAVTVRQTASLLPGPEQCDAVWGRQWRLIGLLVMVVLLDLIPPAIWAALLRGSAICG
jgi:hypothetical protein